MAIYKLFPEQDSFIWSEQQTQNMGRDEILEISTFDDPRPTEGNLNKIPSATRALIKFKNNDINNVINNLITTSSYVSYLKLSLANADQLSQDYSLIVYPISQSWTMGTGKLSDIPITTNGVSWTYCGSSGSGIYWNTSSFQAGITASDNGYQRGGGTWYFNYFATQSFDYISNKDINFNVTNIVNQWKSSSFANDGFIVKYPKELEFNTSSIQKLSYFSMDTHTIYPPNLEFKWDDSKFIPGTSSIVNNDGFITTIGNLQQELQEQSVYRFKLYSRDQYPARSFQTQSVYLNTKILPSSSYWALKDLNTEEMIVDFDTTYTKISANTSFNYFDVYVNGLEPERYYQIMVKTIIGEETIIIENPTYYFKVIR